MIKWTMTKEEAQLINKIVDRALSIGTMGNLRAAFCRATCDYDDKGDWALFFETPERSALPHASG